MEKDASSCDSGSEDSNLLLEDIVNWNGTDDDQLVEFQFLHCIRDAFDAEEQEEVAEWCHALLEHRTLSAFVRACLNMYLALTPGQHHRDRLDIAALYIREAAKQEDRTGVAVSENLKSWKKHNLATRIDYAKEQGFTVADDTPTIPMLDVAMVEHAPSVAATTLSQASVSGEAVHPKQVPIRQVSTCLSVGSSPTLEKSFEHPTRQWNGSLFDLFYQADISRPVGANKAAKAAGKDSMIDTDNEPE